MYLLDTVVLSEMRKRQGDANVLRWLRDKPADHVFILRSRLVRSSVGWKASAGGSPPLPKRWLHGWSI